MNSPSQNSSPWTHRVALVLACATFPLLWVGGLVTTTKAGMAVPDWPGTYGYNLFLYPWQTWILGPWDLFIEHGHRLLASCVGIIAIVFVVVVWLTDTRPWLRYLSLAALALVILQGVLGGLRVVWNAPEIAMVHGCVGPLFFALTVALVALTSNEWREIAPIASDPLSAGRLQRLAWLTLLLTAVQLMVGAFLRHLPFDPSPTAFQIAVLFHVLLALALVVHVALVAWHVVANYRGEGSLAGPAAWMSALLTMQLALGVGTWVVKYGWPSFLGDWAPADYTIVAGGFWQTHIVTAHVAIASLILAQSLRLALWSGRLVPILATGEAVALVETTTKPAITEMRVSLPFAEAAL